MSLIALSLELSVIYVTIHHIARIVLSVAFATAPTPPAARANGAAESAAAGRAKMR